MILPDFANIRCSLMRVQNLEGNSKDYTTPQNIVISLDQTNLNLYPRIKRVTKPKPKKEKKEICSFAFTLKITAEFLLQYQRAFQQGSSVQNKYRYIDTHITVHRLPEANHTFFHSKHEQRYGCENQIIVTSFSLLISTSRIDYEPPLPFRSNPFKNQPTQKRVRNQREREQAS